MTSSCGAKQEKGRAFNFIIVVSQKRRVSHLGVGWHKRADVARTVQVVSKPGKAASNVAKIRDILHYACW